MFKRIADSIRRDPIAAVVAICCIGMVLQVAGEVARLIG